MSIKGTYIRCALETLYKSVLDRVLSMHTVEFTITCPRGLLSGSAIS